MQWTGQGADRTGQAGRDISAGRGDDPRGERRGVHAVLGRGDEVGVDRLHVRGVGLTAPTDHEPLDDRLAFVDALLRHHRLAQTTRGLRDERHRGDRASSQVVARLLVVDVEQLLHAPRRSEGRERALHVDADVTGVHRHRERLRRRQARGEAPVHQTAPDGAVEKPPDKVFDVDAAIAQRGTFLVRLGDLGLESDDAFQTGLEDGLVRHGGSPWCDGRVSAWLPRVLGAVTSLSPLIGRLRKSGGWTRSSSRAFAATMKPRASPKPTCRPTRWRYSTSGSTARRMRHWRRSTPWWSARSDRMADRRAAWSCARSRTRRGSSSSPTTARARRLGRPPPPRSHCCFRGIRWAGRSGSKVTPPPSSLRSPTTTSRLGRAARSCPPGRVRSRHRSPTAASWNNACWRSSASTTATMSPAHRTGAESGWCRELSSS